MVFLPTIYDLCRELPTPVYVSCVPHQVPHYDYGLAKFFWKQRRLAHSIGNHEDNCWNIPAGTKVDCYYLFGDTLLHTKHTYGRCPYLLLKKEIKK